MTNTNNNSSADLGHTPLGQLMLRMAVPGIAAQLINILYSIVDRVYIGHIPAVGASALTGVGLTFPILIFVSAFAMIAGAGGAPLAAIALGKKNRDQAETILGTAVAMLLLFTVLLMTGCYLGKRSLLLAFGASETTLPYADAYLSIYLAGTLAVLLSLGLNPYIIAQGKPVTAMLTVGIGAVLNLILDPVFIFLFQMGIRGAATATVVSQICSAAWAVRTLTRSNGHALPRRANDRMRLSEHTLHTAEDGLPAKNRPLRSAENDAQETGSGLSLKWNKIRLSPAVALQIVSLGISPFIMTSTESLIGIVINRGLSIYGGDLYVGSYTILQSLSQMIWAPLNGFTQGVQPIISFNFGAGNKHRVRQTYRRMILVCFLFALTAHGTLMLFPAPFVSLFTTDTALTALTCRVIRIFYLGMLIFGLQNGIQPTFVALGQAKISLFIACLRKIILLIPLAIILPHFFGVMGVYWAEPVSDTLSVITAVILFLTNIRSILGN